jgi:hypothetical protein
MKENYKVEIRASLNPLPEPGAWGNPLQTQPPALDLRALGPWANEGASQGPGRAAWPERENQTYWSFVPLPKVALFEGAYGKKPNATWLSSYDLHV